MEKKDIIEFFDRCAPTWDAEMIKSDTIIGKILDNAEVAENMDVLDVACGTGVMFDYYLARGVASVTGIDIAPEMAKIAAEKYAHEPKVQVICGDVEDYPFDRKFDRIVVYNAFPHFPDPEHLIRTLADLLKEDGRLTIAHGASREAIDRHHSGSASKVSNGLMTAENLKQLFDPFFDVEIMISNRYMYQVSGVKKKAFAHSHSMSDWKRCVAFHGHECGGLTIGYKAAQYAIELLGLEFSNDEQVVCISENDACGVDAIQVMLGCSVGKGNLLFHMRGKQAFSFFNRKNGKSVRLVLKPKPHDMTREESFAYYQSCEPKDMFEVKETTVTLPEEARIFHSYTCDHCGESTGANWIRLAGDQKLCLDCYKSYDRFSV